MASAADHSAAFRGHSMIERAYEGARRGTFEPNARRDVDEAAGQQAERLVRDQLRAAVSAAQMVGMATRQACGNPNRPGTDSPSSIASHQIPWPSSTMRKSARSVSSARASHSNHETGTDSLRPSRRSTRSHSRLISTAAAAGNLSSWLIEELIPGPQQQLAVRDDDAAESLDLARSVPPVDSKADRLEPEHCLPIARRNVDVRCLEARSIFLRIEVEPVWPEPMDGWHAYPADHVGGMASMPLGAYAGLISC